MASLIRLDFGKKNDTPYTPKLIDTHVQLMKKYISKDVPEVPYPHQEEMFRMAVQKKKCAFFAEQRTGKTMAAIAYMNWATREKNVKRILIICPLTVIGTWVQQITHYNLCNFKVYATSSEVKAKLTQLVWGECEQQIVIVNYEATWRRLAEFMYFNPELVIMDESHKLKNGQSNQHKACYTITKRANYRLLMTGTPIAGNPVDAFYQYKIMDPEIFGLNKAKFIDRYCNMDPRFPRKFVSYKDLDGFTKLLNSASYRVRLRDVVKDMPKDLISFYETDFNKEERELYDTMKKEALVELEAGTVTAPIALTKLLRLHELCGGYLPLHEEDEWDDESESIKRGSMRYLPVSIAKKQLLLEVLKELFEKNPDQKVVIFHRYKPETISIFEVLDEMGIGAVALRSKQDANERHEAITQFQTDPAIKAIVTPISIGGVGIKLNAADTTIFYSADFSSINYEQAKSRVHDMANSVPVLHIHLIIKNTVDKYVYRMLEKKLSISGMPFKELYQIIKGADINDK